MERVPRCSGDQSRRRNRHREMCHLRYLRASFSPVVESLIGGTIIYAWRGIGCYYALHISLDGGNVRPVIPIVMALIETLISSQVEMIGIDGISKQRGHLHIRKRIPGDGIPVRAQVSCL